MYSHHRILHFRYAASLLFVLFVLALVKVQLIDGEVYRQKGDNNRIRLIPIKAPRGRIYDNKGRILADSRPSLSVSIIPDDITSEGIKLLSELLSIDTGYVEDKISSTRQPSFAPVQVLSDIDELQFHKLKEQSNRIPGMILNIEGKRVYPYGEAASQIIGYLGKLSQKEYNVKKYLGYGFGDYIGRMGIEYVFEEVLRGEYGGRQVEVNAKGEILDVLAEKQSYAGTGIRLTIDIVLQQKIEEALDGYTGSVCVMDVNNGEILALASKPGYDPNVFLQRGKSDERIALLNDTSRPFINRCISARYPPGSVFKLVTALAGLQEGVITPTTSIPCDGYYQLTPTSRKFHCWSELGHGNVQLSQALEQSCNVYFYRVAHKLGAQALADFCHKLMMDEPVEIELPGAIRSIIPSPGWKKERMKTKWYQGETLHYGIGQGFVTVTPLQIARLIALIANEGMLIDPTIIKGVAHKPRESTVSPSHIRSVKKGMVKAVNNSYGTARAAKVDFFTVAGKTGTAQTTGDAHSWFAGFFPYDAPQIAIVVIAEHAGSGGGVAANVAKEAIKAWHDIYYDDKEEDNNGI